jgi:hypothetical protein
VKKKSKPITPAVKELRVYETQVFGGIIDSVFTGPVIRSISTAHIKKAVLNVGVVLEMARTKEQAEACLTAAKALQDLCEKMNERQ